MSKQAKQLLVIVPICIALSALTVLLYLLDPEFEATPYIISSMILVALWAFFIVPSFPFAIGWAKSYFNRISNEEAFRLGYLLSCGWGVLVIVIFLIISPISGTIWFIQTIKKMTLDIKRRHNSTKDSKDITENIFDSKI